MGLHAAFVSLLHGELRVLGGVRLKDRTDSPWPWVRHGSKGPRVCRLPHHGVWAKATSADVGKI